MVAEPGHIPGEPGNEVDLLRIGLEIDQELVTLRRAHPAGPRLSYTALRAPFERIGLKPREVWADRVLDEARQTADPVHLVRLFGLHPHTAVKYVHAAHPDKALPRIR